MTANPIQLIRCFPSDTFLRNLDNQSRSGDVLEGWNFYENPTYCENSGHSYNNELGVSTTTDVRNGDLRIALHRVITFLLHEIQQDGVPHPPELEIFVNVQINDSGTSAHYYFIDHATQAIKWLSFSGHFAALPTDQLKVELAQLYWTHVTNHPAHLRVQVKLVRSLTTLLKLSYIRESTENLFPFKRSQCDHAVQILERMAQLPSHDLKPEDTLFCANLAKAICDHHRIRRGEACSSTNNRVKVRQLPVEILAFTASVAYGPAMGPTFLYV